MHHLVNQTRGPGVWRQIVSPSHSPTPSAAPPVWDVFAKITIAARQTLMRRLQGRKYRFFSSYVPFVHGCVSTKRLDAPSPPIGRSPAFSAPLAYPFLMTCNKNSRCLSSSALSSNVNPASAAHASIPSRRGIGLRHYHHKVVGCCERIEGSVYALSLVGTATEMCEGRAG